MSARDPFQELEDALSFAMSPDFSARVRQQVAEEPVRSRVVWSPWLAVAAVAVGAVGVGVMTSVRPRNIDVAPVSAPGVVASVNPPVAPQPEAVGPVSTVRTIRRSAKPAVSTTVSAYETQVPDDQLRALNRLLTSMRAGRATVPSRVSDFEVNDRGERVLRALAIEPVNIELLAGTPAEPNKNPVKDPNK